MLSRFLHKKWLAVDPNVTDAILAGDDWAWGLEQGYPILWQSGHLLWITTAIR